MVITGIGFRCCHCNHFVFFGIVPLILYFLLNMRITFYELEMIQQI